MINHRLQQVFANQQPFGGFPVVLSGDFNQLGPVLKEFIPTTMLTYAGREEKTALKKKKKLINPQQQHLVQKI